jgi:acetyltransferase-like isoleucine patch superfamily enzyme
MPSSLRFQRWGRVATTIVVFTLVQTVVCSVSAVLPVTILWAVWHASLSEVARIALTATLAAPLYVLFALGALIASPVANRLTGAYTPAGLRTRIANFEWPLLRWARYVAAGRLVNAVSGTLFHGSPIWTFYLRLNGARIGRRSFINTLGISDHNLLTIGNDVVLGADTHLSGHTIEDGMLVTERVSLGSSVTVGVGSIVSVGTVIADHCQIGALSYVPKHTALTVPGVYVGVPAHRLA